ncbi:mitochondrial carrier domain-containing protein [Ochromonadaceae sp. CCMP2298]|nr:mitochondrial carrier domain-containing protein [Ochromonadaceae sp. CCMP2298]|eukprot:CAMPEP_0173357852 /NCGR_PEP_ID=MMETSP1144-20121109/19139_1 /TAXON_ID=483371 /ORGANISM="non described non described, Strain CCMP2298" /LENGTH=297 /DNA_ID=CAMNT_0014306895 /DNA_START=4 /DNA_END=897 /DNA_ORIENTATION=+
MSSTAATLQPFLVGGSSAMMATCCVHPIDLAKVRIQLFATINPGVPKPGFVGILSTMVKNDGYTSIYAGLSAALMRQMFYGTARIGLHRSFSAELQARNNGEALSFGSKTLSGMVAGAIAVCIGTPFDVSLVRMQGDSMKPLAERRGYKNVFDALRRVATEEGPAKLYSGLLPNILRGMSMNVGMLACFDQAKEVFGPLMKDDPALPASLQTRIAASGLAGFTASLFSLPFDLIKSRLQDGAGSSIVGVASQVLKSEGPLAFWTGFAAYYMRTAPHAMILLMLSQPLTDAYKANFEK